MRGPDKLELYRRAVQHPPAEVAFLRRAYRHYRKAWPTRLREDFAGTAAVSAAWTAMDEDHRALAVEKHGPTARWARRQVARELGERAEDCIVVDADVLDLDRPKVDIVAALNFSAFIYHDRDALRQYFQHARRCLRPEGLLAVDAFGGPGAMELKTQTRRVENLTYLWEQRAFDAVTHRIDCRIHFRLSDGRDRRNAFRYDWRLWSLPELVEVMREARFTAAEVWSRPAGDSRGGRFRPLTGMASGHEWVAYVVGVR